MKPPGRPDPTRYQGAAGCHGTVYPWPPSAAALGPGAGWPPAAAAPSTAGRRGLGVAPMGISGLQVWYRNGYGLLMVYHMDYYIVL